jgi:hypothetical protein
VALFFPDQIGYAVWSARKVCFPYQRRFRSRNRKNRPHCNNYLA